MSGRFQFARAFGATGETFAPKTILNALGRDADILQKIGEPVKALGPLAPPCIAQPYADMRNGLANMILNLSAIVDAMPSGDQTQADAKRVLTVAVQQLAFKIASTPNVTIMWGNAPEQWKPEAYLPVVVPLPPHGKAMGRSFGGHFWDPIPVNVVREGMEHSEDVDWRRMAEYATAARRGVEFGVLAVAAVTASGPAIVIAGIAVGVTEAGFDILTSNDTTGRVLPKTFQDHFAAFQSKFNDEFLPQIYQQARAVNKAMIWSQGLQGTPEQRAFDFAQHMSEIDPRNEPDMPAGWNGTFPDLPSASSSSTRSGLIAVALGALAMGGVLWALEDD